jgi:hypothetical protein
MQDESGLRPSITTLSGPSYHKSNKTENTAKSGESGKTHKSKENFLHSINDDHEHEGEDED